MFPSWTLLPPSPLPIPSLWVTLVHQPQASSIVHWIWTDDSFHIWYYTYFNARVLALEFMNEISLSAHACMYVCVCTDVHWIGVNSLAQNVVQIQIILMFACRLWWFVCMTLCGWLRLFQILIFSPEKNRSINTNWKDCLKMKINMTLSLGFIESYQVLTNALGQ